ncbi:MAG: response regulator [Pseudomonadota bacterium]
MKTALRCVIVDDEPLALRGLRIRLEHFDAVDIVGEARNGREAVKLIRTQRPDVAFLDIQMPGLGGFDVVESLSDWEQTQFVFVTAYDQFAVKAFEAHALDYLLKPVDQERLAQTLRLVRARQSEQAAARRSNDLEDALKALGKLPSTSPVNPTVSEDYVTRLNIKDRGRISVVPVASIEWIDAAGDYMCVHADGETHVMRETMKTLEKQLDPKLFKRVHRSAIVNLDKVEALEPHSNGECFLKMQGGGEVKVSRSYRSVLNRFL